MIRSIFLSRCSSLVNTPILFILYHISISHVQWGIRIHISISMTSLLIHINNIFSVGISLSDRPRLRHPHHLHQSDSSRQAIYILSSSLAYRHPTTRWQILPNTNHDNHLFDLASHVTMIDNPRGILIRHLPIGIHNRLGCNPSRGHLGPCHTVSWFFYGLSLIGSFICTIPDPAWLVSQWYPG